MRPPPVVAGCGVLPAGETATPTSMPALAAQVVGDAPAFDPLDLTGYAYMLPGAGVVTTDAVHAWAIGFGEQRGDQEVMHLTSSTGGMDWQIVDRRVERQMSVELSAPGPMPSSVLAPDDEGEWVMFFAGSLEGGADGADIWRATASAPEGPWTGDPDPVLARADVPTESGTEPIQLDFPAVVRTDGGYLMLFGWSPTRATTVIRSATSSDGITWRVADEPAIDLRLCGGFDSRSVAMPRIAVHPDGGWFALYGGFGEDINGRMAIGIARSTDGATWTCASSEPLLDGTEIPGSHGIHSYALLASDGEDPRLLVESLVGNGSVLWLAEFQLPQ
jgi:hypothetical protein